jgi:hypothetical protein
MVRRGDRHDVDGGRLRRTLATGVVVLIVAAGATVLAAAGAVEAVADGRGVWAGVNALLAVGNVVVGVAVARSMDRLACLAWLERVQPPRGLDTGGRVRVERVDGAVVDGREHVTFVVSDRRAWVPFSAATGVTLPDGPVSLTIEGVWWRETLAGDGPGRHG